MTTMRATVVSLLFAALHLAAGPAQGANCAPSNGRALGLSDKVLLNNQSGSSFNSTINASPQSPV